MLFMPQIKNRVYHHKVKTESTRTIIGLRAFQLFSQKPSRAVYEELIKSTLNWEFRLLKKWNNT